MQFILTLLIPVRGSKLLKDAAPTGRAEAGGTGRPAWMGSGPAPANMRVGCLWHQDRRDGKKAQTRSPWDLRRGWPASYTQASPGRVCE